ncbi:MAG: hypothetical protein M1510_04105 [Nitrospirae bacterium]|nr:hypothetical protein [Nitrospirota bacterium]
MKRSKGSVIKRFFILVIFFATLIALPAPYARAMDGWMSVPLGDYCEGPWWGWYGARKPVRGPKEARRMLEEYFKDKDVVVGAIKEMNRFYEAEIKDKSGNVIDRVIIDKRTGRIRSIY